MVPKVKERIEDITIHREKDSPKLLIHAFNIFASFEAELVKWQTLRNKYITKRDFVFS